MGRDLLYKPQPIAYVPEEETKSKKAKDKDVAKAQKAKAPAKGGRDLGQVGQSVLQKMAQAKAAGPQVHKHAYFNKDVSGVNRVNLNQSNAKALRGNREAADLRKIVIPPALGGIEHPDPGVLQGAMDLMGVADGFANDLAGLLSRQGAWAKGKGVTVEMIEERMRQLEVMVEARKAALGRMAEGKSDEPITSVTLLQAATAAGGAMEEIEDVASAGSELIQQTSEQALGMHARLAKLFGVKMQ